MKKKETNKRNSQFEEILLEAIDEGFSSLGEKAKTSIYLYLEGNFSIEKKDIPNRVNDFSLAIYRIFGLGAKQLETLFMRNIYRKLNAIGVGNPKKILAVDLTFKDYVELMRFTCEDAIETNEVEVFVDAAEEEPQRL